jgi:hypothetical protein
MDAAAALASAFENDAQASAADAAIPDQILWRSVLLESIEVAYFDIAGGTKDRADVSAGGG